MRMANFWQRLVENLDLLSDILRAQVRVSECCLQGFVAKDFLDGHEAGAVHDQLRSARVPKVVEAEGPRDTRSFEYCFPGFLDVADWKAGLFAFKVAEDEHVLPGLLMHGFQDRSRRL